MVNINLRSKEKIETEMSDLLQSLSGQQGKGVWTEIDDERLQQLLSTLISIYAAKVKAVGNEVVPVSKEALSQTETSIFADQLLKYMEIELFELQIWRSLGSNY